MPEIAELELEPGTRAYETETLPRACILPIVLELLDADVAHAIIDNVYRHELSPGSTNDWHVGTRWVELEPMPLQPHTRTQHTLTRAHTHTH